MEPRPRVQIFANDPRARLTWLIDAAENYFGPESYNSLETAFIRGDVTLPLIEGVLSRVPVPNILVTGLGYDAGSILCSYEHYKIAARVEAAGRDYRMTLVDIDPNIIDDVKRRNKVFVSLLQRYTGMQDPVNVQSWQKYLSDTRQQQRITKAPMEGLHFANTYVADEGLQRGVAYADVPAGFARKLQADEIAFVNSDIATAQLGELGSYDLVSIMNVLYMIPPEGQQLAIANIVASMKVGGLLVVNDILFSRHPLLTVFDDEGWLDDEKMSDLGLELEQTLWHDVNSIVVSLRRIR